MLPTIVTRTPQWKEKDAMETAKVTLNVREVARRLGISQSHCYDLGREGKLPAIRLGARVVVPLSALVRFLMDAPLRDEEE